MIAQTITVIYERTSDHFFAGWVLGWLAGAALVSLLWWWDS